MPDSGFTKEWTDQCRDETADPYNENCYNIIYIVAGWGSTQVDRSLLPLIYRYSPAGVSTKSVIHVAQLMTSTRFHKFDYDVENLFKYGSLIAPSYNLNNVKAPVALWYGDNDWLSSVIDVDRLAYSLPKLIGKYLIPVKNWNHIDYLWARNAKALIYDKMVDIMRGYD